MHLLDLLRFGRTPKARKREDIRSLFLKQFVPNSRFAESYRTLQTNIQFASVESKARTLLVTSASEKEGKTVTAANLAYTLAQAGNRTLLVDADLRKPTLSKLISSDRSPGVTGLLSGTFSEDVMTSSLAEFGVGDLFRLISFQKRTGVLELAQGEDRINVSFLNGDLVEVDWPTKPREKRLAMLLIQNRIITLEQAKQALARQKITGQKLGYILMNMGLLKEEELQGVIIPHFKDALRIALAMRSGEFLFQERPDVHFERHLYRLPGISKLYREVVAGEEQIPYVHKSIDAAILATDAENLFLLPSGRTPPFPTALLNSDRMSFLLSYLERRFERVIIDSPPLLPASDAALLAPRTDGVVLVVRAGDVNRGMVQKAVQHLRVAKANLLGVVLNQLDMRKGGYYYYRYYHKYYASYYGEE